MFPGSDNFSVSELCKPHAAHAPSFLSFCIVKSMQIVHLSYSFKQFSTGSLDDFNFKWLNQLGVIWQVAQGV